MDYEFKMDVKNNEIKAKQELLTVAADLDKKTEAHKEYLENHINAVHRALKSSLLDDEDRLNTLNKKVEEANIKFDSRVNKLEDIVGPTIDATNKRRKIDYDDLKAWLLQSIDERLKNKEKKLEDTVKKSYKSTVVAQKSEIDGIKREISALSGVSPNRLTRGSNLAASEQFVGEPADEVNDSGYADRRSDFEVVNVGKSGRQPGLTAADRSASEHAEPRFGSSIKDTKDSMDRIERFVIDSGDEIGSKLDQQKINIYNWNDKIVKTYKQIEKLKPKKFGSSKKDSKKDNNKEIKGNSCNIILLELSRKLVEEFPQFESEIKDNIENVRNEINDRRDKLAYEIETFESKLSDADANRFKNSRGIFCF